MYYIYYCINGRLFCFVSEYLYNIVEFIKDLDTWEIIETNVL